MPNPLAQRAEAAVRGATEPCDYCEHPIVWTVTESSGRMPVDADATPGGNILVNAGPGNLTSRTIGKSSARAALEEQGYALRVHHKLTCPFAGDWSRPGGPARGAQNRAQPRTPAAPARRGAGHPARRPRG